MTDMFKKRAIVFLLTLSIIYSYLTLPNCCHAFSQIKSTRRHAASNEPYSHQLKSSSQIEDFERIQEVDKSWSLVSLRGKCSQGQEISKCFELKPPFQDLYMNEEEVESNKSPKDELELLFETKKRYFQFHQQNLCYLCANKDKIQNKNILELGAGVGLPSVVCRDVLGASSVVATDFWKESFDNENNDNNLDVNIPTHWHGENLKYNVQDSSKNAFVESLDWTNSDSTRNILEKFDIDVVIGSDLIYYEHVMHPLWNTLEILLERVDEVILFSPLIAKGKRQALPAFRDLLESKNKRGLYSISMDEFQMYGSDGSRFLKMSIERVER
ncbi:hypothetical protein CTEN210_11865 [Chaetoceros tenuissimus]|uniref:Calmodulin-lysine N-methyltransferase n=1 Tax=Chaetoceros tenuissimus TaxID=426638 RepID=A0AAD3D0G9_9STRA|nr:hypothetical protein CTEN210_11865 [Chaetoceros tenuissimus]